MSNCYICGQEISFAYIDGILTPIHESGGSCGGDLRKRKVYASAYLTENFCRETKCPKCFKYPVHFIRHNGGSLWVDELGWPWEKHVCFDDKETRVMHRHLEHSIASKEKPIFALVSAILLEARPLPDVIIVLCNDGREMEFALPSLSNPETLVGELVVISGNLNMMVHRSVDRYDIRLLVSRMSEKRPRAPYDR